MHTNNFFLKKYCWCTACGKSQVVVTCFYIFCHSGWYFRQADKHNDQKWSAMTYIYIYITILIMLILANNCLPWKISFMYHIAKTCLIWHMNHCCVLSVSATWGHSWVGVGRFHGSADRTDPAERWTRLLRGFPGCPILWHEVLTVCHHRYD